jgi:hypothetical protein
LTKAQVFGSAWPQVEEDPVTLALYGKSKRRQSILLIAALIALVGSMVTAMFALTRTEAASVAPVLVN